MILIGRLFTIARISRLAEMIDDIQQRVAKTEGKEEDPNCIVTPLALLMPPGTATLDRVHPRP